MLAKLCSKFFKLGFSNTWNKNFQMYKLGLEKTEEPEIKWPTYIESWRKQGSSRKKYLLLRGAFYCVAHNKLWNVLKEMEYQTILSVSWETYMQVKKQQLEPYMEQLIGSNLGKEYDKAAYCHLVYLTSMQSTSWETLDWKKHKLGQDCREKYQ